MGSHYRAWWLCPKGHEYQSIVKQRFRGSGCPFCAGRRVSDDNCLLARRPDLAKEWHPRKNANLSPAAVTWSCGKIVWWRCSRGHEWRASINHRSSSGTGCPYCAGKKVSADNSLAVVNPSLAAEWHPRKNRHLKPEDVVAGSQKKVWWRCARGHEWSAVIYSRQTGRKCPFCSGSALLPERSLAVLTPEVASQWHPNKNGKLTPHDVATQSNKRVWWLCHQGHEWQASVSHRFRGKRLPLLFEQARFEGELPFCR